MKKSMKKALSLALAVLMVAGLLAGCGSSNTAEPANTNSQALGNSPAATEALPSYAELNVGQDYTDLKAELFLFVPLLLLFTTIGALWIILNGTTAMTSDSALSMWTITMI